MKRLFQLTVGLLFVQTILMVCRVLFFPRYAPAWFWIALFALLALTGILVVYCTILRAKRFKYLKGLPKKLALFGSVLFHAGIVIVILAGFYYALYQYKALLYITEGQTLIDDPQNYAILSEGLVKPTDFGRSAITLREVNVDFYDPNLIEHLSAQVRVEDLLTNSIREYATAVNRPFSFQSRKAAIYKFGLSPLLIIRSSEHEVLWQGFINLDLLGGKSDFFSWPLSGERVKVAASFDEGSEMTFFISAAGEELIIRPGNFPASFQGLSVEIPDYRYWLGFVVSSSRGTVLIWVALFLAMSGIVLRYLYIFKDSDYRASL